MGVNDVGGVKTGTTRETNLPKERVEVDEEQGFPLRKVSRGVDTPKETRRTQGGSLKTCDL